MYIFLGIYLVVNFDVLKWQKCNKNKPKRAKNSPKQPYFFSLSTVQLHSMQQETKA